MENLVEVKIDSLRVSLTNQQRIIVLKDIDQDRYLPIWIGPFEAEAITIALQEIEISRPQTHDLFKNMLSGLDAQLLRVIISDLSEDIFYGTLVLKSGKEEIEIDSRPSDAIAIAVREHVPILVAAAVMDEASIIPEEIALSASEENDTEEVGDSASTQDRLSIFEDYLKKNINGKEDKEGDSDDPDSPSKN
jgi:bifunctional DNase/RNase